MACEPVDAVIQTFKPAQNAGAVTSIDDPTVIDSVTLARTSAS